MSTRPIERLEQLRLAIIRILRVPLCCLPGVPRHGRRAGLFSGFVLSAEAEENTLSPHPPTIKIMIVDRNKLGCEGLTKLILDQPGLQVVGEAGNGPDACALAKREQPDVILLDLDLVTEDGLDILPGLLGSSRESRVLVLAHRADREAQRKAMLLGAMGVIRMEEGIAVLCKAIEKVHEGEVWYDRAEMGGMLREILQSGNRKESDPVAVNIATLTAREHEVVGLISEGLKNKDIGEKLFISETTVRHHLTSIFDKLEVSNRLELIIFAFSEGLASLPDHGQYHGNGHGMASEVWHQTRANDSNARHVQ